MSISFLDTLVDKGMNREDLARVSRAMIFHYSRVNDVHTKISACNNCPLHMECTTHPVTGTGNLDPEIVVVSDQPEENEDRFNMSGFSKTAMYLMVFFSRLGIEWDDIFWTHAVKCPSESSVKMLHINECHVNLVNQLAVLKPTVIIALGSVSISSLAGERIRINDAIGEEFHFSIGHQDVPVIPITHPRTFLEKEKDVFRKETNKVWRELKKIQDIMDP